MAPGQRAEIELDSWIANRLSVPSSAGCAEAKLNVMW